MQALLDRLPEADQIDWERASLDSASVPAKKGSEKPGPNPTDKGKPGMKRYVVVDRRGIPLSVMTSAANVNDSMLFEESLDSIEPIKRPKADRGSVPRIFMPTKPTTTRSVRGRSENVASRGA